MNPLLKKVRSMLSEKRKADRAKMADMVVDLVREFGFGFDRCEGEASRREELVRVIAADDIHVSVDFDGESRQPDVYVLNWWITPGAIRLFDDSFADSVNGYHRHKATDVAYGFDHLMSTLRARFSAISTGKAFVSAATRLTRQAG